MPNRLVFFSFHEVLDFYFGANGYNIPICGGIFVNNTGDACFRYHNVAALMILP